LLNLPAPDLTGRRCAVVGSPIAHSLSPVLHRAAYRHLGLDWTYSAHQLGVAELGPFVAGLDSSWRGLSVTMPLKKAALDLADRSSELAHTVGAANTLLFADDGTVAADNTDVGGMVATIDRQLPRRTGSTGELGSARSVASACVWGAGATAASALAALARLEVDHVHLHVRDLGRAAYTLAVADAVGLDLLPRPWHVEPDCADADVVLSTVPSGAADGVADEIGRDARPDRLLFDVVYAPWPTAMARAWTAAGGAVASGLDLLVHQAVGQVELMTGSPVLPDVLYAAVS
jgi:shikimate dehydrogenase